jgi:hypothetical protein
MSVIARMIVSISPLSIRASSSLRVNLPGVELLMRLPRTLVRNGSRDHDVPYFALVADVARRRHAEVLQLCAVTLRVRVSTYFAVARSTKRLNLIF